ncbi:hypothetical protein EJB05_17364, partial [Eragrostis curvula]
MARWLLPLLLLLISGAADAFPASCSSGICGDQAVHYPFWLLNSSASGSCGYPGLGVGCEDNGKLILPVHSHRYRVERIDYDMHTVAVSDTDLDDYGASCPRLRVNLTLDCTSSWLQLAPSDSNITFLYNCKRNISLFSAVELTECREEYDNKRSYVLPDGATSGTEAFEWLATAGEVGSAQER